MEEENKQNSQTVIMKTHIYLSEKTRRDQEADGHDGGGDLPKKMKRWRS